LVKTLFGAYWPLFSPILAARLFVDTNQTIIALTTTNMDTGLSQILTNIFRHLAHSIILCDSIGSIFYVSPACEKLFGLDKSSHNNILQILTPLLEKQTLDQLELSLSFGPGQQHTTTIPIHASSFLDINYNLQISACEIKDAQDLPNNLRLLIFEPLTQVHDQDSLKDIILDTIDDAIFLAPISDSGEHGNFVFVNNAACKRLAYTPEELLALNARTLNPTANNDKVKSFGREIVREKILNFESLHQSKTKQKIPVTVIAQLVQIDNQNYVLSCARDLRYSERHLQEQQRFGKLLDHSWDEIFVFDAENLLILQANEGAIDNLQYTKSDLYEKNYFSVADITQSELKARCQALVKGKSAHIVFETQHVRKDGSRYPVEVRLQISHDETPPVFLANVHNITKRKQNEKRLQFLANYDSLTGLPNRTLFFDRLYMAIETEKRTKTITAVFFIDLDGFKFVNDSLGHDAGDQVLILVSQRLKTCLRRSDTVARLAGDEFTAILTNLKSVEDADLVAQKILESVKTPYVINGKEISLSCSIGISYSGFSENDNVDELLKQADSAMYYAKEQGKNKFCHYMSFIDTKKQQRIRLSEALKHAIEKNEFHLVYQPRIDLENLQVSGAEALLRWTSPEHGIVPPTIFIPLAEEIGLINEIGLWVLEQVILQNEIWHQHGYHLCISLNVSAKQLDDDEFLQQLNALISHSSLPAHLLEVEITEGILLEHNKHVDRILRQIQALGIDIALDDFGSGYSSLSYVNQYPIDIIKIDRYFLVDIQTNNNSMAIVEAIVSLGKHLGLKIVAEGIEEEFHVEYLREIGCKEGQGYYFAKPMTVKNFETYMASSKTKTIQQK